MSYENMDHAGWLEREIRARQTYTPRRGSADGLAPIKGWYAAPQTLNPFQRRAVDILGIVGNGIYNAPIAWGGVIWNNPRALLVPWRNELATFDFIALTNFVFLCHEARIRGSISHHSPRHIQISLHEREAQGSVSRRHPNLFEAIQAFRQSIPLDHPICFDALAREEAA